MLKINIRKRWPAKKCLAQGFKVGLFKRRVADGLVVCASDLDDLDLPTEEGDDGASTPKPLSSRETWQVRTEASHARPPNSPRRSLRIAQSS